MSAAHWPNITGAPIGSVTTAEGTLGTMTIAIQGNTLLPAMTLAPVADQPAWKLDGFSKQITFDGKATVGLDVHVDSPGVDLRRNSSLHWVFVLDEKRTSITMYLNGKQVETYDLGQLQVRSTDSPLRLSIGASARRTDDPLPSGTIAVWNRAFSSQDVQDLFNEGKGIDLEKRMD
jgi:hypothetical protein